MLSFMLSTFIVLFVLFRLLRFKTILISFLSALATTIFAYIVFAGLLGVTLPSGTMEQYILKITGLE
jgi:hypothetical protein